jgi:HSP20 family protein
VGLKADKIKADFKDGVLKIDIPKPEEEKPKQITIH